MFRRHGAILINLLQTVAWLLLLAYQRRAGDFRR